jgi:hypothetical protein
VKGLLLAGEFRFSGGGYRSPWPASPPTRTPKSSPPTRTAVSPAPASMPLRIGKQTKGPAAAPAYAARRASSGADGH